MYLTSIQHRRAIDGKRKLHAHMRSLMLRTNLLPDHPYSVAVARLWQDIQNHEERHAYYNDKEGYERDKFVLWPSTEAKLSRGRAGDVDPGGALTKQQCGRGTMRIGNMKHSVSSGEW